MLKCLFRQNGANMGEELEPIKESLEALVGETGLLGPVQEYGDYLRTRIHLRHLPALVERAMAVAEKIRALDVPQKAWEELDEPLVTAILQGMAEETIPALQEAWENLLVHALTESPTPVRRAFPRILRELEPADAALLDSLFGQLNQTDPSVRVVPQPSISERAALDNLARSELVRYSGDDTPTLANGKHDPEAKTSEVVLSAFGFEFLMACRAPQPPQPQDD
jgi:hypothetical protein